MNSFFTFQSSCWVICLLLCLEPVTVTAQTDFPSIIISEGDDYLGYGETYDFIEVLVDLDETYSVQEVVANPETPWVPISRYWIKDDSYAVWTRTSFVNEGTLPRSDYLYFSRCLQDSRMYIVQNGEIIGEQDEADHHVPNFGGTFLLQLEPGEEKTIYWRGHFIGAQSMSQMGVISLLSTKRMMDRRTRDFAVHYLYAGLLLAMALLGLALLWLFDDRAFGYFALLNVGFVLYFLTINRLIKGFRSILLTGNSFNLSDLAIVALVIGFSGFLINYLELYQRSKTIFYTFFGMALLTILISFGKVVAGTAVFLQGKLLNIALLTWVLFIAGIVVWTNLSGKKRERILLYSIATLFVFSMVHVISLIMGGSVLLFQYSFQVGTLLFSGFLFYVIFNKVNGVRQEARRLSEQDRFKSRFFTNISHEFRTPLTLILGPVQQLLDRSDEPADRELLSIVQRNANRQLELVNQIMDLSRLEAVKILIAPRAVDVVPLLRRLTFAYESLAGYRNIQLKYETEIEELVLKIEPEKMETIIYNLITNAFKFTPDGGAISVGLKMIDQTATITVTDTGKGISLLAINQVFNRFYSTSTPNPDGAGSTGVGLALTRELVMLHGGEISVVSVPNERTTFTINLPYEPGLVSDYDPELDEAVGTARPNMQLFQDNEIADQEDLSLRPNTPLALVVEDNVDMRTFIRSSLKSEFRVLTAADGQIGWSMVQEHIPDLVISDVMMPNMDGFELCQEIKTDITTSHVPVILLTARSANTDLLTGLEIGADDYLTKPFRAEELLSRARNLVRSRQLLRERFATAITLKPEEVTATSVDREFLKIAVSIVEDHLDDNSLNVEVLTRELGMSRSGLNRKLRALLDQSSNQFIQGVRLERAADLLVKSSKNIGEIAMDTGFSGTAYFIKCFRSKYGVTPGVYRKANQQF